jgi:DNA-binding PadR family transcriptional regulator
LQHLIGALYTELDRWENKGLIKTWVGDPTPERGGRSKRLVRITAEGVQAASESYEAIPGLAVVFPGKRGRSQFGDCDNRRRLVEVLEGALEEMAKAPAGHGRKSSAW